MSGSVSTAQARLGIGVSWKTRAWRELESARARTLGMLAGVPEAELLRQHSPLMSPLVWDVAHVANYEEQWLLRSLGGPALTSPAFDAIYDAFRQPRRIRSELPLLSPAEAFTYAARVRQAVREHLDSLPEDSPEPLLKDGFAFGMVAQHEQQHAETLAATLQLMTTWEYRPAARERPRPGAVPQHEVFLP
jgi:iron(II)-dependent oxidoreductase